MEKIFLLTVVFSALSVSAQSNPPPVGAFEYSAGSWIAAATTSTTNPLPYTPPAAALYCLNGSSQWVPADSSCFGGGSTISLTTTGTSGAATLVAGVLNIPVYGSGSGSGTVNAGTAGQIPYYPADGTAVGPTSGNMFWDSAHNVLLVGPNASTLLDNPPTGWPDGAWTSLGPSLIVQITAVTDSPATSAAFVTQVPQPFPVNGPGDSQVFGSQSIAQYTSNSATVSGQFFGGYAEADVIGNGVATPIGFDSEVTNQGTGHLSQAYGNQTYTPWNSGGGTIDIGVGFDVELGDTTGITNIWGYNCNLSVSGQVCFRSAGADNIFSGPGSNTFGGPIFAQAVNAVGYKETLTTPASSSATCTAGQFTDDANFHYVCTATNTWKRAALLTF